MTGAGASVMGWGWMFREGGEFWDMNRSVLRGMGSVGIVSSVQRLHVSDCISLGFRSNTLESRKAEA